MVPPRFLLGGSAWLNLMNTRYRRNNEIQDVLIDPEMVLLWLQVNQLLRECDNNLEEEILHQTISELMMLRGLCQELLSDLETHTELSTEVFDKLKSRTERLSIEACAAYSEGKLLLTYEGKSIIDHITYLIIASIFETLKDYSIDRIRKCEHENCILHFVDTSKSGKRRWCRMETCGNRHKAAEFYTKKKQQT